MVGGMTDLMVWFHEHGDTGSAKHCWKSMLLTSGAVVFKRTQPEDKFIVLGICGYMVYLWPAEPLNINRSTCWQHRLDIDVSLMTAEPIIDVSLWRVIPTVAASPAQLFLLNGRRILDPLPRWPALQVGDHISALEYAAKGAFKGWHKTSLLRLDREEVHAVTSETTKGAIMLVMIQKVRQTRNHARREIQNA